MVVFVAASSSVGRTDEYFSRNVYDPLMQTIFNIYVIAKR